MELFGALTQDLIEAGFTEITNGKTHLLEMPDERDAYPYTDAQILQISNIIRGHGIDTPEFPA